MFQIASIGSCLSSLTSVHLVSDFACNRINNLILSRTDHFRNVFLEKTETLPPIEVLAELLGLDPDQDPNKIYFYLYENYPHTAGISDFPRGAPSLLHNLLHKRFDLLVLDNLGDATQRGVLYKDPNYAPFRIVFPILSAPKASEFWSNCELLPFLTPQQSAANWAAIIRFFHVLQPSARIVFLCAPSCLVRDLPDRFKLASEFPAELGKSIGDLPVDIIPPLEVPHNLTKLPDDRDHFDMKIYRALAGRVYLTAVGHAAQDPDDAKRSPLAMIDASSSRRPEQIDQGDTPLEEPPQPDPGIIPLVGPRVGPYGRVAPAAAIVKASPFSLKEVVASFLKVDALVLTEESGAYEVDNWDSLNQLKLVSQVEQVFGVSFPFDDITNSSTIAKLRNALKYLGVAPADTSVTGENLFARFIERAIATPDERYALVIKQGVEEAFSNRRILSRAVAAASHFRQLPRGAIVAIVLDHSAYQYSTFIGCVLAGLVPTFLPPLTVKQDPDLFRASMTKLFDRIRPAAVMTTEAVLASVPATDLPVVKVEDIEVPDWATVTSVAASLLTHPSPGDLAFLQHSSGTTGLKKGVMLTHAKVLKQVELYCKSIGFAAGDIVASWLPLYHDMGLLTSFIIPTVMDCSIISMDAIEWVTYPTMLLDRLQEANYCWLPNFAFHHILRSDDGSRRWDFQGVKAVISCSEPCRSSAFDLFAERYATMGLDRSKLGVSYAMAENVFAVTQSKLGATRPASPGRATGYLSSGAPLSEVEIKICDPTGEEVTNSTVGEIYLRSPCLFDGYYNIPDLSAERLQDGWYMTRDLGLIERGELFVIGRVDDLLIINGKNIVAHEVEDQLNEINGVAAGRILIHSEYSEESGALRLVVLAEPSGEPGSHQPMISELRSKVFSLCGVAPSEVRVVPRGFLVKSSAGKLARSQSWTKWRQHTVEMSL